MIKDVVSKTLSQVGKTDSGMPKTGIFKELWLIILDRNIFNALKLMYVCIVGSWGASQLGGIF